jgi:two-component system, chemotaxis family, chemotaxis protein CheY
MNILIIDDSMVMRNINKNILLEHKVAEESIICAGDGEQALKITKENDISLFLVDWNMPKLDGLGFVKKIREMEQHKNTPIIMITSEAAKYMVVEAVKAGVTNYIVKPIKSNVLWEKIEKYIN